MRKRDDVIPNQQQTQCKNERMSKEERKKLHERWGGWFILWPKGILLPITVRLKEKGTSSCPVHWPMCGNCNNNSVYLHCGKTNQGSGIVSYKTHFQCITFTYTYCRLSLLQLSHLLYKKCGYFRTFVRLHLVFFFNNILQWCRGTHNPHFPSSGL